MSKLYRKLDTKNSSLTEQAGQEWKDELLMHEEAGLAYGGFDEEKNVLWIGTDLSWKLYEELRLNKIADNNINK